MAFSQVLSSDAGRLTLSGNARITSSAPARVDMGGTLDMPAFYYPLGYLNPLTVNLAVSLRTRVEITASATGENRIVSKGFNPVTWPSGALNNDHPLGFVASVLAAFRADGLTVTIDSASPPRSGMGGSSTVAVALIAGLYYLSGRRTIDDGLKADAASAAHGIESSVLGIPCGMQDHLAAAFGGVNAWYWNGLRNGGGYYRKPLMDDCEAATWSDRLLVAYTGAPHDSAAVNSIWMQQFLKGGYQREWEEIVRCTHLFCESVSEGALSGAAEAMNRETDIRCRLTPEVLTPLGKKLSDAGRQQGCGVRFTGAGAGGCLWALGDESDILRLAEDWQALTEPASDAYCIDCRIDPWGVEVTCEGETG